MPSVATQLERGVPVGESFSVQVDMLRHGDIEANTGSMDIDGVTLKEPQVEFSVDYDNETLFVKNQTETLWNPGAQIVLSWQGFMIEPAVHDHETRIAALEAGGSGGGSGAVPIQFNFHFVGMPLESAVYTIPVAMAVTIPAGLAGSTVYDRTQCTSNAVFILSRIVKDTSTIQQLGSITVTRASHMSCNLAGAGGQLDAGDVLQITAPVQDPTLADVSLSIVGEVV